MRAMSVRGAGGGRDVDGREEIGEGAAGMWAKWRFKLQWMVVNC